MAILVMMKQVHFVIFICFTVVVLIYDVNVNTVPSSKIFQLMSLGKQHSVYTLLALRHIIKLQALLIFI